MGEAGSGYITNNKYHKRVSDEQIQIILLFDLIILSIFPAQLLLYLLKLSFLIPNLMIL